MTQDILKDCTVEGMVVKLPAGQLDRKVYLEIKKKLELIGGKWKGGKAQGFVFEEDPSELLGAVANGDDRNLKKEFQFFATPPELARKMVDMLPFVIKRECKIIEPSAGSGIFLKVLHEMHWECNVDCYEPMEVNKMKLAKIPGANIIGDDFLQCDKKGYYDIIIANPPFSKNQDIDHIRKMYEVCKPKGTIVTLSSPSWTSGSQKKQIEFREWLDKIGAEQEEIDAGTFKDSGTSIRTVLLKIIKPVEKVRTCRVCGCTDDNCIQCIEKTGFACHWMEEDLCSACVNETTKEVIDHDGIIDLETDTVEKIIDGFKFNKFGSCLNPKILLEYGKKKSFAYSITVAKTDKGWNNGYDFCCNSTLTGTGSGGSSPNLNSFQFFDTIEEAALKSANHILEYFESTLKKVPQLKEKEKDLLPLKEFIKNYSKVEMAELPQYQKPEEIIKQLIATNKKFEKSTLELQKMISPENNNNMNFFQQLFEQLDGIDLTLNIKRKNGKITLSVLPQTAGVISPALITGTPEELDEGFFDAVKAPIAEAKGLNVDLTNLETSIKQAKEKKEADLKEAGKSVAAKPAATSTAKKKNEPAKKPAKKIEKTEKVKPIKEETPKASVPDLFANV